MTSPQNGHSRHGAVDGFINNSSRVSRPVVRRVLASPSRTIVTGKHVAVSLKKPTSQGDSPMETGAPLLAESVSNPKKIPLPVYIAPKRPVRPVKKQHVFRTWGLRFASLFIALFLATGGFLFWKGYSKLHKVFRGTGTVAALSKNVDPLKLNGEGDGRVNVLLLGIGGAGHDGPDLTDTMLILSVDPVNNTAVLLSVPRDLWVKMPVNYFGSYQKINAAYESGKYSYLHKNDASNANAQALQAGFATDDTVLNQVLGLKINYHVLIDFQAFKQAIDTVGGVTVDVPNQLYDPTMAWENGWNPILAKAGVQVMAGKQALMYARSRETSTDFARSQRQRQIILSLKDKVLSAGTLSDPAKIDSLMNAFGDNVYSDLSTQGAERMYNILKNVNDTNIKSIGLADAPNNFVTTDHVGNISIVRPSAGLNNYAPIQTFVRTQLKDGFIVKENAPLEIINASNSPKAGILLGDQLKTYGYNVTDVSNSPTRSYQHTILVDLSGGADKYTKHYLEDHFKVTSVTKLPDSTISAGTNKFVIIIGQNETVTN